MVLSLVARISSRKDTAKRFLQRIKAFANRLKEQPRIGRVVPEFGLEHLRERIFGNYRIVYRLQGEEEVLEGEIVAVIHTRREMPELN